MKRKRYRIGLAVLCAALLAAPGTAAVAEEEQMTRVSVILPHRDDGYWDLVREGIEEAAEEPGTENLDINILFPQLNYNIDQMTELLKQQIAAQVDTIVIQGNEDEDFLAVLQEAWDAGIQIICVDTDISDFPDHLYIGTDNYAAGELLGEELAKLTGGMADVIVMSGEESYLNLQQRLDGLKDAISDSPGIEIKEILYDNYDGLTASRLYQEKAGEADAMVFLEGTGALTLTTMGEQYADEYEYIVGFDAAEGARDGILDGIVLQDTNRMGHQVVEEILRYKETGSYSADVIFTDIYWVMADNYDEVTG